MWVLYKISGVFFFNRWWFYFFFFFFFFLVCWFFVFLLFFGASRGFQVLGISDELRGEDGVCCVFLECLFGSKFYDLDLRFSLHYCTTPISPLGSPASSESPDVRCVLHRPLHTGAWHSRAKDLPGVWWSCATLPATFTTSDDGYRKIAPSLPRASVWVVFVFGFLSYSVPAIFVYGGVLSVAVLFS
jgi:hypothetical protein